MENYKKLADFIIELMNTHFDQSYLQQIIDVLKTEEEYFVVLLDLILKKFFLGRNCLFKNNDLRFIIKNTLSIYGPNFYLEKLAKFLNTKSNGGSRTAFQLNQAFNLLTFVLELSSGKLTTDESFKEKLSEKNFAKFTQKLNSMVKLHLADDETNKEEEKKDEEKNEEEKKEEENKNKKEKKKQKKKKNKKQEKKSTFDMFLICLANYLDRLFSFEKKLGFLASENDLTAANDKLIKLISKISSSLNFNNVVNKLQNINKKLNGESNDSEGENDNEKVKEDDKMDVEKDDESEEEDN